MLKRLYENAVHDFRMSSARQVATVRGELIVLCAGYTQQLKDGSVSPRGFDETFCLQHHSPLIVLQLDRDLVLRQADCSHLLKAKNVFRREIFEVLFQGLFIDLQAVLKTRVEEKIVVRDRRASPGGVVAASPMQRITFKEIQQAQRLKQRQRRRRQRFSQCELLPRRPAIEHQMRDAFALEQQRQDQPSDALARYDYVCVHRPPLLFRVIRHVNPLRYAVDVQV